MSQPSMHQCINNGLQHSRQFSGTPGNKPDQPQRSSAVAQAKVGGRTIWYRLSVVQNPMQARACGSGPKSIIDRRPVDPPPVVQLRLFEGENLEEAKEITLTNCSDFFVYAQLQHARDNSNEQHDMTDGSSPTNSAMLAGTLISGMSYLDRPTAAAYFIFTDLAVRHEGMYTVVFYLYERITVNTIEGSTSGPIMAWEDSHDRDEFVEYRLHVESKPFNGYSAKKFPGLSESTELSKTFSEQGCRLRMRRDARLRRRKEAKPSTNSNNNDFKTALANGRLLEFGLECVSEEQSQPHARRPSCCDNVDQQHPLRMLSPQPPMVEHSHQVSRDQQQHQHQYEHQSQYQTQDQSQHRQRHQHQSQYQHQHQHQHQHQYPNQYPPDPQLSTLRQQQSNYQYKPNLPPLPSLPPLQQLPRPIYSGDAGTNACLLPPILIDDHPIDDDCNIILPPLRSSRHAPLLPPMISLEPSRKRTYDETFGSAPPESLANHARPQDPHLEKLGGATDEEQRQCLYFRRGDGSMGTAAPTRSGSNSRQVAPWNL